jgi:NADH dehydrogenase FAD-containing subunit
MTLTTGKHLVFAGAGHTHLHALARLDAYHRRGVTVTVISRGPYWYSGMAPGLLSGIYSPAEDCIPIQPLVEGQGGTYLQAEIVRIDAEAQNVHLAGGRTVHYDVLSLNLGSRVPLERLPGAESAACPVKPMHNFMSLRERITQVCREKSCRVLVVGGGAAGCETSANAYRLLKALGGSFELMLFGASGRLLPKHPPKAGRIMERWLKARAITVRKGVKALRVDDQGVMCSDGACVECDVLVLAMGVVPCRLLRQSDELGSSGLETAKDGALLVNRALQSVSHPNVFGGGDCVTLDGQPLDRVGVYAVRQAPVLHHNLLAYLSEEQLRTFKPQRHVMLILNLADGTGLLMWRGLVFRNRFAFRFKDWIDKRFVRQYQKRVN